MKQCPSCNQHKILDEFYKHKGRKDGVQRICRACSTKVNHEYRPKRAELHRLKVYGVSETQYRGMLATQNNRCGICKREPYAMDKRTGTPRALGVDHHHTTGKVRGLLCVSCNNAIGLLFESIEILGNAIQYLTLYDKN